MNNLDRRFLRCFRYVKTRKNNETELYKLTQHTRSAFEASSERSVVKGDQGETGVGQSPL